VGGAVPNSACSLLGIIALAPFCWWSCVKLSLQFDTAVLMYSALHTLLCWGTFLLFLVSSELLSWKNAKFCQRLFLHLLRWLWNFSPWVCLCVVLHLSIATCWTKLAYLEWKHHYNGLWSFKCAFKFSLKAFYENFYIYVLKEKLVYIFLFFCVFLYNLGIWKITGFIEWAW
jgi:hypothetical protein